jgi:hypothetical protein
MQLGMAHPWSRSSVKKNLHNNTMEERKEDFSRGIHTDKIFMFQKVLETFPNTECHNSVRL